MTTDPQPNDSTSSHDADLQREIEAAFGDENIDELVEQSLTPPPPLEDSSAESSEAQEQTGRKDEHPQIHHEFRRGRIAAIRGDDVFVELAGEDSKMQGIVPAQQFDRSPRIGSIMDFVIDHVDEGQGLIYLSREGAASRATWDQLTKGAVVDARVTSTNKGGLDLEMVGSIRAFMPASQIDLHHVNDLEQFVGQKLEATVQEIDRKSRRVVLSRRQLLHDRQERARRKVMAELEVGQVREGVVTNLTKFGAFVDLGGVDGLIHVTDLSYSHVDDPGQVVQRGQTVQVKVLKISAEKGRISLGLKQVQPDPWANVAERIKAGDQVSGRVVRIADFGAFVAVEDGVEGLLPISEMSWKRIGKPEDVVQVNEVVSVKVLSIEPAKRRLSLSLKQSLGDPWMGAERKFEKHGVFPGKVIATTDFGAFVELEPGVEGLVHISELSPQHVNQVTDVVSVGDEKKFRVLEVIEEERKIRLSLKQAKKLDDHGEPGAKGKHKPTAARRPKKPDNLKGGMDVGGVGLGGISLDDIK